MGEFNDSYYCPTTTPRNKSKDENCITVHSDAMDGFGISKIPKTTSGQWR